MTRFAVGIDGGGSGTRALLADEQGVVLARADAGPSALGLGVERAWDAIGEAARDAFASAGIPFDWRAITLCCGLSGVNNAAWHGAFEALQPPVAALSLVSDAYTTLWGAHGGRPGVIVALGTGSIAAALVDTRASSRVHAGPAGPADLAEAADSADVVDVADVIDASHASDASDAPDATDATDVARVAPAGALEERISGGYGFPSGDEASGAWLGLRALVYLQQVMDGRRPADDFSAALRAQTGATSRDALVAWSCDANQTAYATLAPIVLAFGAADRGPAERAHPFARALLEQAGDEIARMIDALDPDAVLPIALCGGLAGPLAPYVPARFVARLRAPVADSVGGALAIASARLARTPPRQAGRV
ncbi:BadF/BadG/BcrA/BcrD ATPase family protein [Pararobbsia silviterrae]|uniref:ATPase n=1 Tax=Pararobbsia silviterrae TaxID=1792498 RepID=A0A494Y9L0_9BURK|nr:BadF/BadG/BcrA/BcrD ATPase family protein [Pararobbsia silviterrae]RKP59324.1 ATPase [Pararobbsia silviterrae]